MNEQEIDLAMRMLIYSVFASKQEVKNATAGELMTRLQYFFSKELLTAAENRLKEITNK